MQRNRAVLAMGVSRKNNSAMLAHLAIIGTMFLVLSLTVTGALATTDTVGSTATAGGGTQVNMYTAYVIATASGVLQTVGANMNTAAGNIVIGIYANNTTGNVPGALLAVSSPAATVVGWQDADVSGAAVSIVAGTQYWLALSTSLNSAVYAAAAGGTYLSYAYTGSMPNPYGPPTGNDKNPNMRMTYAPATAPVYLVTDNITYDAEETAYCYAPTAVCTLLRNGTDVTADENDTAVLLHRGGWNYTATVTLPNSTQSWAVVAMPSGGVCAVPDYGIKVKFISEKLQIMVR